VKVAWSKQEVIWLPLTCDFCALYRAVGNSKYCQTCLPGNGGERDNKASPVSHNSSPRFAKKCILTPIEHKWLALDFSICYNYKSFPCVGVRGTEPGNHEAEAWTFFSTSWICINLLYTSLCLQKQSSMKLHYTNSNYLILIPNIWTYKSEHKPIANGFWLESVKARRLQHQSALMGKKHNYWSLCYKENIHNREKV
jgi:hypothetical protein